MKKGKQLMEEVYSTVVPYGNAAFWWIGQLGYIVKLGERILCIDGFLSEHPRRQIDVMAKPEELAGVDYFFGTHDHTDHIDRKVWKALSLHAQKSKFVVPSLLKKRLSSELDMPMDRFIGMNEGLEMKTDDLTIKAIPAAHEFLDYDEVEKAYPYLGYIIEGNGVVLYHSGDTCIYEGMQQKLRQWPSIDVMFLPINGRDGERLRRNCIGNMTYQEAVDLAGALTPGLVVPGHYEMFIDNSEDPERFRDYLNVKFPGVQCWIGAHGERVFVK